MTISTLHSRCDDLVWIVDTTCGPSARQRTRTRPLSIFFDSSFHFRPEMSDEALNRPCSRISQGTDCMSFNFFRKFPYLINLLRERFAL